MAPETYRKYFSHLGSMDIILICRTFKSIEQKDMNDIGIFKLQTGAH